MGDIYSEIVSKISKEEGRHGTILARTNCLFDVKGLYIEGALNAAAKLVISSLGFSSNKDKNEILKHLEKDVFREIDWKDAKAPYDRVLASTNIVPVKKSFFGGEEYDYRTVVDTIVTSVSTVINIPINDCNKKTLTHFCDRVASIAQERCRFKKPVSYHEQPLNEELSFDGEHCEMWYYLQHHNPDDATSVDCIIGKKRANCGYKCPIKLQDEGFNCLSTGDSEKALSLLSQAVELAPQYASALTWLGYTYSRIGEYDKTIEMLEKVFKSQGFNGPAGLALIHAYYNNGDIDKALNQFFDYTEKCEPKIHPGVDEYDVFKLVTKICKEEAVSDDVKLKVANGIKKMRSAEGGL